MYCQYVQLPKVFYTKEKYRNLPHDARELYALLRDRMSLSEKNGWKREGCTYILFTQQTMADMIRRSLVTVRKALKALVGAGLLFIKRQGLTKPNMIFVQLLEEEKEASIKTKKKDTSGKQNAFHQEGNKASPNQTYSSYPYQSIQKKGVRQQRFLDKKPLFPREGDIWPENGQYMTLNKGYVQRYYLPEELNLLLFDPFASTVENRRK